MPERLPGNEEQRLSQLQALQVLDTASDDAVDSLVDAVADSFDVPAAFVSFVDSDRVWFKAKYGFPLVELPLEGWFCAHAVLSLEPLVVPDAIHDDRFSGHPLVTGSFGLRFYAGAPILVDGLVVGTLGCLDTTPRTLTDRQLSGLCGFAKQVAHLLKARRHAIGVTKEAELPAAVVNGLPCQVGCWNASMECEYANEAHQIWHGKTAEQMIGISLARLVGDEAFKLSEPHLQAALAGEPRSFERTVHKEDGSQRHLWTNYHPRLDIATGEVVGFFEVVIDITQLKHAEGPLRLAAKVFDNALDGIMVTDHTGTILSVNQAFSDITGYSAQEAIGQSASFLKSDLHTAKTFEDFWHELQIEGIWEGEFWSRRKDGSYYLQSQTVTAVVGETGVSLRYVTIFKDATEQWRKNERARHLALHDPLTGLANRLCLTETLEELISQSAYCERQFAIMFCDLDGFKPINDTFGHATGDALLTIVAERLEDLVRPGDTVARVGGDEFVLLIDRVDQAATTLVAERLLRSLAQPIQIGEKEVHIGASIGIAIYPCDAQRSDALLESADHAMYKAKKSGRNTFRFFEKVSAA